MSDLAPYCRPVGVVPSSSSPTGARLSADGRKRVAFERGGGGGGGRGRVVAGDDDDDDDDDDDNDDDDDRGDVTGIGTRGGTNSRNSELKRRCIDYHNPSIIDLSSRLYRKPHRRSHALHGGSGLAGYVHMQCHANYLRNMGMPCGEGMGNVVPSHAFLTYCAHVTRAKNSNPVM
jgi:hypothetical protein